jgi:hypothetical protein
MFHTYCPPIYLLSSDAVQFFVEYKYVQRRTNGQILSVGQWHSLSDELDRWNVFTARNSWGFKTVRGSLPESKKSLQILALSVKHWYFLEERVQIYPLTSRPPEKALAIF